MARCGHCGKIFDYEKYYGICPKCSAYNREKLPEDYHQELHEAYDDRAACGNGAFGEDALERPDASAVSIVVFVLLILGIVASIAAPFLYVAGKGVNLSLRLASGSQGGAAALNEEEWASLDEAYWQEGWESYERVRQSVEPTLVEIGEPCILGSYESVKVEVAGPAYVAVPAGLEPDFPENEKLVAIPVSYEGSYRENTYYYAFELLYVQCGERMFRKTLTEYELEDYRYLLEDVVVADSYNLCNDSGQGVILVFVPEESDSVSLFLESRDEDNYQLLDLYQIPLEIKEEEAR